jgi:hypothetical protein
MMHEKMKKLMGKKKDGKLSPVEKDAKSSVLKDLSASAAEMMKEKLGGMKKATIMADSPEGMKKGAELVEKIAGAMPNGEESEESGMEDAKEHEEEMVAEAEGGEEAEEEGEEKSKEQLLAELERLKAKIEAMG